MNDELSKEAQNPRERKDCKASPNGYHKYTCVRSTWDDETYECKFCGDSYKIYEDEMK